MSVSLRVRKITLASNCGAGKSATCREFVARTGYKHYSAGDYNRDIKARLGVTQQQFEEICRDDPVYDFEVDGRTTELGRTAQDFIFDGRIAWNCIPDSLKVLLVCEDDERFRRIAEREGIPFVLAREQTLLREETIRTRFERFYDKEMARFDDPKHFDLVIDTTRIPVAQVVDLIIAKAS